MKRCLVYPLIFALVLSLGCFAFAEDAPWTEAYARVLQEKQQEAVLEGEQLGMALDCWYVLYDIDKDGTPELIIKLGTCEADYHGDIYTLSDDNTPVCIYPDFGFGHCSAYSDPGENGVIMMHGHMGYAWADRLSMAQDGTITEETLYEDNLNERLATDPDAEYVYPEDVVPGSAYLDLCRFEQHMPFSRYEEITSCLAGVFPPPASGISFPEGDPGFFTRLMNENREVVAVTADGYTKSPGRIHFQELMKKDVADNWMNGDMTILSSRLADLNGDGKPECIVDFDKGEYGGILRAFLSEQEGTVYAYLQNYVPEDLTVDKNGNILGCTEYYSTFSRLIFDREEAMLLTLPMAYYAA